MLLAARPAGGFRPQIAVGPGDLLHVVYYDRVEAGDIIRYRSSADGVSWTDPETISEKSGRNWGPDLVLREDGDLVLVYDHALEDFSSRGWLRVREQGAWGDLSPLTPAGAVEMGSGHVANGPGDSLAYVHIRKALGPENRFRAYGSWYQGGSWTPEVAFTDGRQDTWHSNVERRPDGSVLVGYDVGVGGTETELFIVEGHPGSFKAPESLSASSFPGERPNFAFTKAGIDLVTWFRKDGGFPRHIYVRAGRPGHWEPPDEPSRDIAGYHFDPDIAVASDGTRCLVWGWDGGANAELVYSLWRAGRWDAPRQLSRIGWGKPGLPSVDVDSKGTFHVVWTQGIRGTNEVYYQRIQP